MCVCVCVCLCVGYIEKSHHLYIPTDIPTDWTNKLIWVDVSMMFFLITIGYRKISNVGSGRCDVRVCG